MQKKWIVRPSVYAFLFLQLADIILTEIGLELGLVEVNPLGYSLITIALKFFVMIIIAIILQRNRLPAAVPVLIVSGAAVTWNLIILILKLLGL